MENFNNPSIEKTQLETPMMEICQHNDFCGGCLYQGVPYDEQLRLKGKEVERLMAAKGIHCQNYQGISCCPNPYRYRNKMEYTFGDMIKDGEMTLGMHQKKRFMSIVTVDGCQLVDEDFNRVLSAVLTFCKNKGYPFYHKKTHTGFLRHLILRKGERTGELLVNLITSSQGELDEDGFVQLLVNLKLNNRIVGILNTTNDGLADFIYCDSLKVLWGRDYYVEQIMGLRFKVSAFSFFQTNVAAVERLYSEAVSLIGDLSDKTVFDLYCGTGTISQVLSARAKSVVGVEIVEEAVSAARENARENGLANCSFVAGDVLKVLDELEEKPDMIVVDPPRVGIHPKALEKIAAYAVEEILYISCNPKTLMENLYYLQCFGYTVVKLKAYDNFPFTKHTECVALLQKSGCIL